MVRFSMISVFVCMSIALGARPPTDGSDIGNLHLLSVHPRGFVHKEVIGNRSSTPDDLAHPHIHQEAVIPGHTALEQRRAVSLQAVENGECQAVLAKVKDLVKSLIDTGASTKEDRDLLKGIIKHYSGPDQLEKIEDLLAQLDLEKVLEAGTQDVITVGDIDLLIKCELPSHLLGHLEDNTETMDGEHLWQGDMCAPVDEDEGSLLQTSFHNALATGQRWAGKLWPDGHVNYCFDPEIRDTSKSAFERAVYHLQDKTCLTFKQVEVQSSGKKCAESPGVFVQSSDNNRCYSYVGISSKQRLNLGEWGRAPGIAEHELLHTLGMVHELSRPDRDQYVTIKWDNIKDKRAHNFKTTEGAYTDDAYDYYSLMHYGRDAFAKMPGTDTITARNSRLSSVLGQATGMSEQDIQQVQRMYACAAYRVEGSHKWWTPCSLAGHHMITCGANRKHCCCKHGYKHRGGKCVKEGNF